MMEIFARDSAARYDVIQRFRTLHLFKSATFETPKL